MSKIELVTVGLPVEALAAIKRAVAGGEYASEAEAVAAAVCLWSDARESLREGDGEMAALWDQGVESGPGEFGSIDAILAEASRRLQQKKA